MSTKYKAVGFGACYDGENEQEVFLVVPRSVTLQQITAYEIGDDEDPYEWVAECPTFEAANKIAELLNADGFRIKATLQ